MEHLIRETISIYMDDKMVIRNRQHRFNKGKPCLTDLFAFYNETTTWMDEGKAVDIVYFNFSMAFQRFAVARRRRKKK